MRESQPMLEWRKFYRSQAGHEVNSLGGKGYLKVRCIWIQTSGSMRCAYLPLSAYHWRRSRNALMSVSILSETPGSSTTLRSGRFRLGCPNGFHSIPHAVWITSFPSLPRTARSLASVSRWGKRERSRVSAVSVTVSQGTPDMSCIDRVSRSRFICQLDVSCVDQIHGSGEISLASKHRDI